MSNVVSEMPKVGVLAVSQSVVCSAAAAVADGDSSDYLKTHILKGRSYRRFGIANYCRNRACAGETLNAPSGRAEG